MPLRKNCFAAVVGIGTRQSLLITEDRGVAKPEHITAACNVVLHAMPDKAGEVWRSAKLQFFHLSQESHKLNRQGHQTLSQARLSKHFRAGKLVDRRSTMIATVIWYFRLNLSGDSGAK